MAKKKAVKVSKLSPELTLKKIIEMPLDEMIKTFVDVQGKVTKALNAQASKEMEEVLRKHDGIVGEIPGSFGMDCHGGTPGYPGPATFAYGAPAPRILGRYDVHEGLAWASALLYPGAQGQVKLFTVPQGQPVPCLVPGKLVADPERGGHESWRPDYEAPVVPAGARHTNLMKSGEFGSGLGDLGVTSIRFEVLPLNRDHRTPVDASEEQILNNGVLTIRVAGKRSWEGPLTLLPASLTIPLEIARTDTIEALLEFE